MTRLSADTVLLFSGLDPSGAAGIVADIETINQFRELVVEDFINYLDWDEERVSFENAKLDELLYDATHFYDNEIEA